MNMVKPFTAIRALLASLTLFVAAPGPLLLADQSGTPRSLSSVEMPYSLHFTGSDGSDIVVPAGTYALHRGSQTQLRLIADDNQFGLAVQAVTITHVESLEMPVAVTFTGTGSDDVHLLLLFPGGEGLDATGSMTGV